MKISEVIVDQIIASLYGQQKLGEAWDATSHDALVQLRRTWVEIVEHNLVPAPDIWDEDQELTVHENHFATMNPAMALAVLKELQELQPRSSGYPALMGLWHELRAELVQG